MTDKLYRIRILMALIILFGPFTIVETWRVPTISIIIGVMYLMSIIVALGYSLKLRFTAF